MIKTRLLRLDLPMPPADEREQRIFLVYGLLAAWYIASIMLLVAGTVYGWLEPARSAWPACALFVLDCG